MVKTIYIDLNWADQAKIEYNIYTDIKYSSLYFLAI